MTADEPPVLASGRDADLYLLADGRVLRRYRAGGDVTAEAELMRYVASLGYPVPPSTALPGRTWCWSGSTARPCWTRSGPVTSTFATQP